MNFLAITPQPTHTFSSSKQACCSYAGDDGDLCMLDTDTCGRAPRPDALSYLVFGRAGLPLSPVPPCIAGSDLYHVMYGDHYKYIPVTNYGTCNFLVLLRCDCAPLLL